MSGLAIAMLAHSTNPRGGVVHALELCDALAALGHWPELFAPDVSGQGFYREAAFRLCPLPVAPSPSVGSFPPTGEKGRASGASLFCTRVMPLVGGELL